MKLVAFPSLYPPPPLQTTTKPGSLISYRANNSSKLIINTNCLAKSSNNSVTHEQKLPAGLREELMPKHVAVIMDGNRRWAVERGWPVVAGHAAGRMAIRSLINSFCKFGIKVVTVYMFSTENWNRRNEEVRFLMHLFEEALRIDLVEMTMRLGIQVTFMGDKSRLPKSLLDVIFQIEERSKSNSGTIVNLALNYSGKYDIIQACRSIARKAKDGVTLPQDINESLFEQELCTNCIKFPCPDLLIRTSGEMRLSNFMLWQLAYTELYFVDKYFPDFGEEDLIEALQTFQKRPNVM